jgi:hypothetical protein
MYGSTPLVRPWLTFQIFYTVGRTFWKGDQSAARPLSAHRTGQIQNKCTDTSMPEVGEDSSCLRPRGHCDRQTSFLEIYNSYSSAWQSTMTWGNKADGSTTTPCICSNGRHGYLASYSGLLYSQTKFRLQIRYVEPAEPIRMLGRNDTTWNNQILAPQSWGAEIAQFSRTLSYCRLIFHLKLWIMFIHFLVL